MPAQSAKKPNKIRAIDPNVLQRQASNPEANIWVNASAGTGKTKVLTDRVLRLLLPRANGTPATSPQKILGITFTKAGANEMLIRITHTLRQWAVLDTDILKEELKKLSGSMPTQDQLTAARTLFAKVTNTSGGLKIMTIHSFCQSVLGRFPLEAGISPNPKTLEESESKRLILQAQKQVLIGAIKEKSSPASEALHAIATIISETQFSEIINGIINEQHQLRNLIKTHFSIEGMHKALCEHINVNPHQTANALIKDACQDNAFNAPKLRHIIQILSTSTSKTDQKKSKILADFLSKPQENRHTIFNIYCSEFLKKDGDIKAKLVTKTITKNYPETVETLNQEAERLYHLQDTIKATQCATLTKHIFFLGNAILKTYEQLKKQQNALDYDDMISKTLILLQKNTLWVLYKLDQGIDHILVDEAQDTNPEQWDIIKALCEEFYTHIQDQDNNRSIFIVGDQKQSIYSFQRASPAAFEHARKHLKEKVTNSKRIWKHVDLNISFRSTPAILSAVDSVFTQDHMTSGIGAGPISHQSFRRGQAGHVELWPIFENNTQEEIDHWEPATQAKDHNTGADKLAEHIAEKIHSWINNKEELQSQNRAINAGDIMILVRSRSQFVHKLNQALKNKNIPTSGTDRLILTEHIAVQDLIALINFTLLPEDDLTLACLLKSPLIGLNEDQLYTLAINRENTLWDAIKNSTHDTIKNYLNQIINWSQNLRPYEFLNTILYTPCPANDLSALSAIKNRLGLDAEDPLHELLNLALDYEREHIPNLQLFSHWLEQEKRIIKRDNEESTGQVRIMTIHGSKGLQAPIVIMPDTMLLPSKGNNRASDKIVWPDKTSLPAPLWSPRSAYNHSHYKKAQATLSKQAQEEYQRLLYVAMTRAEDRLYIGGHTGKTAPSDQSWYFTIKASLERNANTTTDVESNIILENPQTATPDKKIKHTKNTHTQNVHSPKWLTTSIAPETKKPTPLTPSKTEKIRKNQTIKSYIDKNIDPFMRGNITHKLLEILPNTPKENHQNTAKAYVHQFGKTLPLNIQNKIIQETLAILNNSTFGILFTKEAMAEVPITGQNQEGHTINGQIDRLLITDKHIWIIDYKTGQPAETANQIPQSYKKQLQAYANILSQIYPEKQIKAALLWTDGPTLMPVIVD